MSEKSLTEKRRGWARAALNGGGWKLRRTPQYFGGGRRCICGRLVYSCLVLSRPGFPDVYVGSTCALTVFAYQTGGLDE